MIPPVTVLIAVYNGEPYLAAAIDSILAQTYRDFELLIINDGSTDRSAEIVAAFQDARIRLVNLPVNRGLSGALNEGVRLARGAWIARQDADDIARPRRLAHQLQYLDRHRDVALLGSQATRMSAGGAAIGVVRRPTTAAGIRWFSIYDNPFIHTSVMFKAEVVRDLGGYDAAFDPFSQDYDLWCRIMERHAIANLDEELVGYRVNESSITGRADEGRSPDYARQFDTIAQTLTVRQARRLLGADAVADADAVLLAGLVRKIPLQRVADFLRMFERLHESFVSAGMAGAADDLPWTLARQFDALSYRVTPASRASAMRIYSHLLRHHPEVARHISWTRMLALIVAGRTGRDRLSRMVAPLTRIVRARSLSRRSLGSWPSSLSTRRANG